MTHRNQLALSVISPKLTDKETAKFIFETTHLLVTNHGRIFKYRQNIWQVYQFNLGLNGYKRLWVCLLYTSPSPRD